jgi:hypothetical protein
MRELPGLYANTKPLYTRHLSLPRFGGAGAGTHSSSPLRPERDCNGSLFAVPDYTQGPSWLLLQLCGTGAGTGLGLRVTSLAIG